MGKASKSMSMFNILFFDLICLLLNVQILRTLLLCTLDANCLHANGISKVLILKMI